MKEFTIQLNKLLEQYPDLGEFTIHVRPRLTIQTTTSTVSSMGPVIVLSDPGPIKSMEKTINKAKLAELASAAQIQ